MNYIILAAGQSSRMGTDKLFIKVNGSTLIERALRIIRSEDEEGCINLIVSNIISQRWKKELSELSKVYKVNMIKNTYDSSTTTNSATMKCVLEKGKYRSYQDVIVVDSDLYFDEKDFRRLYDSNTESRLVVYGVSPIKNPYPTEYVIDFLTSEVSVTSGSASLNKGIVRSIYKINLKFLKMVNKISSIDNMQGQYFDDYILRCLNSKISWVSMDSLLEFDNIYDLVTSELLSLDELRELIDKTHMNKDSVGMSNESYFTDSLFIKIFNKKASDIINHERERQAQIEFEHNNLTPKVLAHTKDYAVSERVIGYHPTHLYDSILDELNILHRSTSSKLQAEKLNHDTMMDQIRLYKSRISFNLLNLIDEDIMDNIESIIDNLDNSTDNICLCHGDLVRENILISSNNKVKFIDFEYACLRSKHWDLATLALEFDRIMDRLTREYAIAVDYIWWLWSMMDDKIGKYYDYGLERLDRAKRNFKIIVDK